MSHHPLAAVLYRELQRIKSTGDYSAIRELVERYGVKVDPALHAEVRARYAALDVPAYSGFIGPRAVLEGRNGFFRAFAKIPSRSSPRSRRGSATSGGWTTSPSRFSPAAR